MPIFSECWSTKCNRIQQESPYGSQPSWDLNSFIVKTGSDLRQEQLAIQCIRMFRDIWIEEGVSLSF